MSHAQHGQHPSHENEETGICSCWKIFKCKRKQRSGESRESEGLLNDGKHYEYESIAPTTPIMPEFPPGAEDPIENEETVEKIEMKRLRLPKVDEIFAEFQNTYDAFYECQDKMHAAVMKFKTARQTTGEFLVRLNEFKQELNAKGKDAKIKRLAIKFFPNDHEVFESGSSVGDKAKALVSIFKAYTDMEKLPVKVTSKSVDCLKKVMALDFEEIAGEEFSGSVLDLAQIPEQIIKMHDNIKEIKKATKIVTSFFDYATSIVMDVIEVFGNEENKKELTEKKKKVQRQVQEAMNDELGEVNDPKPPKEIKFASLGIPTVDEIFDDVANLVNPVIKLSKDLFDARKRLEQAMKAVSEFRDDPSKAFDDYLEELKKRLVRGEVHIMVSFYGDRVQIEKVEGLEPKAAQDMQSGFESVLQSAGELTDLAPKNLKRILTLVQDTSNISKRDIKDHVSLKDLPSTLLALNENRKEAKKIPRDLRFFLRFVQHLIMDILGVLHTKKGENQGQDAEEGNDGQ